MFPNSVFSIFEIIGLLGHPTVSMFQFMAGLILQAFWVLPKNPKQIYSHLGLKKSEFLLDLGKVVAHQNNLYLCTLI